MMDITAEDAEEQLLSLMMKKKVFVILVVD
jgi:hypothetical protein